MKKLIIYILGITVVVLAIMLVAIAMSYFTFDSDYHFLKSKQHMLSNNIWKVSFYTHLLFGSIAILAGTPLFIKKLIRFKSKLHKTLGKIYIVSILFITGPTGLYLAFYAEGGSWASLGFVLMSFAWMIPTYIAYKKIREKDFVGHYRWIIRSYCMTLSGVTLRIMTPIGSHLIEFDYDTNFIFTSYACWIFNILLGELILLSLKKKTLNIALLIR